MKHTGIADPVYSFLSLLHLQAAAADGHAAPASEAGYDTLLKAHSQEQPTTAPRGALT
jgi:hypothetical protein